MAANNQIQTGTSVIPLLGVTDASNAAAGIIGEYISSTVAFASAVSLSTGTPANITSISLTAGDWDVQGNVSFNGAAVTNPSYTSWISTTSASVPDFSLRTHYSEVITVGNNSFAAPVPFMRISISGTTTVYISAQATFTAGTVTGCGGIYARRVR